MKRIFFVTIIVIVFSSYEMLNAKKLKAEKNISADVKKSVELVTAYLSDYLNNFLTKGYIFQRYLHEDFISLPGEGLGIIIVSEFSILNSKKDENGDVQINVELNQIANVDFTSCDVANKKVSVNFVLRKTKNKRLIFDISDVEQQYSYLKPALEWSTKNMTSVTRTQEELNGYKYIFDCLNKLEVK